MENDKATPEIRFDKDFILSELMGFIEEDKREEILDSFIKLAVY